MKDIHQILIRIRIKNLKTGDGKWGFSFLDKDGDLAGSYTVDIDDGYVIEYDEDGEEVGSGY